MPFVRYLRLGCPTIHPFRLGRCTVPSLFGLMFESDRRLYIKDEYSNGLHYI